MALVNVSHNPITGRARQWDGTMAAFTEILGARALANVTATIVFDNAGANPSLRINGGAFGNIALAVGDWVVFPTDTAKPPLSVSAATATTDWTQVP